MADYSAQDLVADAKARHGESILRTRMRGAGGDADLQDLELVKIAQGVISSFQAVLLAIGQWPLPGTWPDGSLDADGTDLSGVAYSEVWPFALQERALDIFNFRSFGTYSEIPKDVRDIGLSGEKFLVNVQAGTVPIEVGTATNVSPPETLIARKRDGTSNFESIPDTSPVLDMFRGGAWDYLR